MLDLVLFYFFAALAVAGAIMVVTRRNVVHSAIFLATTLLATAGIFLSLNAEFLFIVQIILYTGGIMVLYVFVIMLVNLDLALHQVQFNRHWLRGAAADGRAGIAGLRGDSGQPAELCTRCRRRRRRRSSPIRNRWPGDCSTPTCCRLKSLPCCCWWP